MIIWYETIDVTQDIIDETSYKLHNKIIIKTRKEAFSYTPAYVFYETTSRARMYMC